MAQPPAAPSPAPRSPAGEFVPPSAPRATGAGEDLGSPDAAPSGEPAGAPPARPHGDGFVFSSSREQAVAQHVQALRARPEDTTLPCWPRDLVKTVPAAAALAKGDRPLLVVFYDETAKASRLAAADLWPVVLEVESRVDLVLVDLTPGPRRTLTDDERRLVRRYYLGYVPTTVVLGSDRVPRLLKSERVEPAVVRAAAMEAK